MKNWIFAILLPVEFLSALPRAPEVVMGSAEFRILDGAMEIQLGDCAEIDWNSFSIAAEERVCFIQPSAESLAVNRVIGADSSEIFGNLVSNGQVVLVNRRGVFFGKEARIDVGSFIASTLDVINQSFLENREFSFGGASFGEIRNEGCSTASQGDLFLIGRSVVNQGTLEAAKGAVGLFGAARVDLGPMGFERVFVRDESNAGTEAANLGSIRSSSNSGGGGSIYVFGDHVLLGEGSKTDASGFSSGGTVLIGGDFQGRNEAIQNASNTWVQPGAFIDASARHLGDGGKIVIWSDRATAFYGEACVRAGQAGGNGGFVEVSSPLNLVFKGRVDSSAVLGESGILLLDPSDIVIDLGVSAPPLPIPTAVYDPAVAAANIAVADLNANLDAVGGSSIVISTSAGAGGSGDIRVEQAVSWGAVPGRTLTLNADRDIFVAPAGFPAGSIASTSAGCDITLHAGRNISVAGIVRNIDAGAGAAVTLIADSGSVTVDSTFVGSLRGDVTVLAHGGDVNVLGNSGDAVIGFGAGAVVGDAAGDILVSASRDINLLGGPLVGGGLALISKNGPTLAGNRNIGALGTPSNIAVNAGRNLFLQSFPGFDGWASGIGSVLFTAAPVQYVGDVTINVGNDCTVLGADNFSLIAVRINPLGTVAGLRSTLRYNIGRDLVIGHIPGFAIGDSGASLGAFSTAPVALISSINARSAVYANVGGNFIMDAQQGFAYCTVTNDGMDPSIPKEMLIHVGGDLILRGGDDALGPPKAAAIDVIDTLGAMLQIWVGGSIVAINGENGAAHIHAAVNPGTGAIEDLGSVSVRAGGDIRAAGGGPYRFGRSAFDYYASGGISYISDSPFAQGELWAPQTAIVNGFNIFTGTPLQFASGALALNGLGAVSFDHNFYNTNLQPDLFVLAASGASALSPLVLTSPGNLIVYGAQNGSDLFVSSQPLNASAAAADLLNIGTGASSNRIQFSNALAGAPFSSHGQDISLFGWRDAAISGDPLFSNAIDAPDGNIFVLTQRNMFLSADARVSASMNIDLVIDNQAPVPPLIGNGGFFMDGTSVVSSLSGYIRVYTARQNQNVIDPAAQFISAGIPYLFLPGTLFVDTDQEKWCTYFPFGDQGVPFKIFYKPCLQLVSAQAMTVIDEFLVDLHPYNEYPGWSQIFWLLDRLVSYQFSEPYYIGRRVTNFNNHPKTWTQLTGGPWEPIASGEKYH